MIFSIYVTAKDKKEAEKISKHLLSKKLIACANIFPVDSFYLWRGKLAEDKEYAIIAKTNESADFKIIEKEIKKIHSYSIPCICRFRASANKEYENWLKKELKRK